MSTPLGGEHYTLQRPDTAYIIDLDVKNKRLQQDVRRKTDALMTANETNKAILNTLDSMKKLLDKQIELTELQKPQGKTYDTTLTLPAGSSARLVHIDFIAGNKSNMSILPANANLDFPFGALYSLEIANDGPAAIFYSTNEARSSSKATIKLNPNESKDLGVFHFPTFETLNIVLEGGATQNTTVRINGLA